jgi:hypothetical protein
VSSAPRATHRFPHANKLAGLDRMAREAPARGTLTDCDVVFAVPPEVGVTRDAADLRAAPANRDGVPANAWSWLSRSLREPGVLTEPGRPYLNSGLIQVGATAQRELHREWSRAVTELIELFGTVTSRPWMFFADQIALTFAVVRLDLQVAPLPAGDNMPTHIAMSQAGVTTVRSLHYHDAHTPEGFLLTPRSAWLRPSVDAANQRLAERLETSIPNLRASTTRYRIRRGGRGLKHAVGRARVR